MNPIYASILLCLLNFNVFSQYQFKNKKEIAIYNITSSAIIGAIGALINNHHKEKNFKAFANGFYKGALSGAVIYAGKDVISNYPKTKNYGYIWGSKFLVFTGISMLENTVENKKFFDDLHLNIGFVRFDFFPYKKFKIKSRIMPYSLSTTIWFLTKYKLSTELSLKTGNFIFTSPNLLTNEKVYGKEIGKNIIVTNETTKFDTELILTHEMIHVFQLNYFSSVNTFYFNLENNYLGNTKVYKWYKHIFYSDYENLSFNVTYSSLRYFYNINNHNYKKNIFEGEAFMMSKE